LQKEKVNLQKEKPPHNKQFQYVKLNFLAERSSSFSKLQVKVGKRRTGPEENRARQIMHIN
jgi:hypothetical protein